MSAPRTHRGNDSDAVTDEARIGMVGLRQRGIAYATIGNMQWPTRSGKTRTLSAKAVKEIIARATAKRTESDYMASMLAQDQGGDE